MNLSRLWKRKSKSSLIFRPGFKLLPYPFNFQTQQNFVQTEKWNVRNLVLLSIIFTVHHSFAKEKRSISLSANSSIMVTGDVDSEAFFPHLNTRVFFLQVPGGKEKVQVLSLRQEPFAFANSFSVDSYWKKSRAQTKAIDRNEKDFGCQKLNPMSFLCRREVAQNGNFYSEALYWYKKKDLILVRIRSGRSFENAASALQKISFHSSPLVASQLPSKKLNPSSESNPTKSKNSPRQPSGEME